MSYFKKNAIFFVHQQINQNVKKSNKMLKFSVVDQKVSDGKNI